MRLRLLLLTFICHYIAQSQTLKGVVYDNEGVSIPFARVGLVNSTYATLANGEGKFQLQVETGTIVLQISAHSYETIIDTIVISKDGLTKDYKLNNVGIQLQETTITAKSRKNIAYEIMKKVIDQRSTWNDAISDYDCNLYAFTGIELEIKDSVVQDSIISKKKMNIAELYTHSYVKNGSIYKDSILGSIDLSEKAKTTGSVSISLSSDEDLQVQNAPPTSPYLFVQGLETADLNLFKNQIESEHLTQRPLISPMAYNATIYYIFDLEGSFFNEKGQEINKIKVTPRFREEALYSGVLYIENRTFTVISADLQINKGALSYFKELHILMDYDSISGRIVPTRREFSYTIKEGRKTYNGQIKSTTTNYSFNEPEVKSSFWLSSQVDDPKAYDRDSSYWASLRPFELKENELQFIHEQDSITAYHESEEYLLKQDSTFNTLSIWDFLFNGVGFRNTFKKQEIYFNSLINQMVFFGVGGYRHRLRVSYSKEFENAMELEITPTLDYGFLNKDLKGELDVNWLYNPKRFSRIYISGGDIYDLVTNYQSIQGTFAPANRVRNQKFSLGHSYEVVNGLYFKTSIFYSNRKNIADMEYPSWVDIFGNFSTASDFEDYSIFMTEIDFEYHFRQKYLIKKNKKIIVGTEWPIMNLSYKKGIPNLFGGQSDFDFLEFRIRDEIKLAALGSSQLKLTAGTFLRKKDLRLIEYKYFRTSDFFFSNPVNSLQLLDTLLSTNNSYMQFNFIHHFEGFFLNKVWGINRLKLQETIGGSFLGIPDANFAQAEFYAGIERQFRIKKQIFKIGIYAVTADSSFDKMKVTYKFGINFYDRFYKKWTY